ncbi:MAG: chemotaxis protein CheA [Planctomyces sp.]|nr:chemotaxis protein CheA [Planctomyces sp.]
MQIDLNRFRAAFFEEADEHLTNMEAALLQLEASQEDPEILNTIFRAAHSIKGASSTFGIDQVARFTHVLENLLDRMRDGEIIATTDLCHLLLQSTDVLSDLIHAERQQQPAPGSMEEILTKLHLVAGASTRSAMQHSQDRSPECQPANQIHQFQVRFQPSRDFFLTGQNPLLLINELRSMSQAFEVEADVSQIPALFDLDPESLYLAWNITLETDRPETVIRDVFMFVDDGNCVSIQRIESQSPESAGLKSEIVQGTPAPMIAASTVAENRQRPEERRSGDERRTSDDRGVGRETVRVDRERLDKMINQIGELVIGTSMVEQDWSRFHGEMESSALVQLGKIVRDLQEMSLSLRMVPIAATFQKMARIVRDLSLRLGKQIRFETEGEDTELDKTVVDQIGDPLLHMIRNSVDHGIELPAQRLAAGKPAEGRVCLRAYHQGGNFIIEIQDDGRGLDRDRILKKAIDRGIVSESDNLTDDDVYALIFAPGFSTAEQVTDVSGRGVGMDVVRRNVEALQGSISIRSTPGKGCRMIVRLPLTLAILDGLLVRVGQDSYVIPLLSVVESIKPSARDIRTVLGRGEIITLRGEVVPILRVDRILNLRSSDSSSDENLLVIVEDQGRKYSLVVDELLGQQQVVIKNLETNFQKVPGVAGATILGDGRVALILDINGLCSLVSRHELQACL